VTRTLVAPLRNFDFSLRLEELISARTNFALPPRRNFTFELFKCFVTRDYFTNIMHIVAHNEKIIIEYIYKFNIFMFKYFFKVAM